MLIPMPVGVQHQVLFQYEPLLIDYRLRQLCDWKRRKSETGVPNLPRTVVFSLQPILASWNELWRLASISRNTNDSRTETVCFEIRKCPGCKVAIRITILYSILSVKNRKKRGLQSQFVSCISDLFLINSQWLVSIAISNFVGFYLNFTKYFRWTNRKAVWWQVLK